MRQEALRQTLSAKLRKNQLVVLDAFDVTAAKTKLVYKALERFGLRGRVKRGETAGRRRAMERDGRILVLDGQPSEAALLSTRNLQKVDLMRARDISALQVDQARTVLVTREGVAQLEQALGRGSPA
jgi:ribosomal protein L4